jgi:hypothetical protein
MIDQNNLFYEKREDLRVRLEVEVMMTAFHRNIKIVGWVNDISHGGFKVKANIPHNFKKIFQKGDAIYFETFEDFYNLKGHGGIVWISPDGESLGVKFDQLLEESRSCLNEFLGCFNHSNFFSQDLSTQHTSSPFIEVHK